MPLLLYTIAVLVAAFFLWINLWLFALYFFMVVVFMVGRGVEALLALIRVSHTSNGMKIMAIAKKLGVSDEEFDDMTTEAARTSPQEFASLQKDARRGSAFGCGDRLRGPSHSVFALGASWGRLDQPASPPAPPCLSLMSSRGTQLQSIAGEPGPDQQYDRA